MTDPLAPARAGTALRVLATTDLAGTLAAFAELKGPVKDRLQRYGLYDAVGHDKFFPTVGTAVDGYVEATGTTWIDWEERTAPAQPG